MVDPRVTHLWDSGNLVDQGFLDRFGVDFGGLDYDFFLLSAKKIATCCRAGVGTP